MSRIGIITIHNSPNYGACLQSYALYEFLRQEGHDVEVIDLHRPYHDDYILSKRFRPYSNRFESKCHRYKQKLKNILKFIFDWRTKREIFSDRENNFALDPLREKTVVRFNRFNDQIALSRPYLSIDELYANPPVYDTYITGSDQVWNPTQAYCIEPYFLTFVKKGRMISYASSIGIESLTKDEKSDFKKWLSRYDIISVREESAQKLLEGIVGRSITTVPDPTFLIDVNTWLNLAKRPPIKGYILVFTLSFEQELLDYAINVAKKQNATVISLNRIQPENKSMDYVDIRDAGPEEWLGYIANASLILTDSFHCTLFSILLGVNDFKTYISPYNDRGSRIKNLLKNFSLDNHLLSHSDLELQIFNPSPVNYDAIKKIIRYLQQIGRDFLSSAV